MEGALAPHGAGHTAIAGASDMDTLVEGLSRKFDRTNAGHTVPAAIVRKRANLTVGYGISTGMNGSWLLLPYPVHPVLLRMSERIRGNVQQLLVFAKVCDMQHALKFRPVQGTQEHCEQRKLNSPPDE